MEGGFTEIISKEGWSIPWDSLGTSKWKEYLRGNTLVKAWSPPEGSPFGEFMKTRTIYEVDKYAKLLKPRFSMGELRTVAQIENLIKSGVLGKNTAVILDSGGGAQCGNGCRVSKKIGISTCCYA